MPLFDRNSSNIILAYMRDRNYNCNDYAELSTLIPYTARQVRQYWTNNLDPRLCHDPFEKEEKDFIIQWIEINKQGDSISWRELIHEIESKFDKLRSKNKIKNFWYSRQKSILTRRLKSKRDEQNLHRTNPSTLNPSTSNFLTTATHFSSNIFTSTTHFASSLFTTVNKPINRPIPPPITLLQPNHEVLPPILTNITLLQPNFGVLPPIPTIEPKFNPEPPKFNLPLRMNPMF